MVFQWVLWTSLPHVDEIQFSLWLPLLCITNILNVVNITNKNNKEHNKIWSYILDPPYRILIIDGSGLRKTSTLINLISQQNHIDKIYLHAKDLSELKNDLLIRRREDAVIKHLNDHKAFIESLNTMDDVYENIDDYNPDLKKKNSNCLCWNDCRHYDK